MRKELVIFFCGLSVSDSTIKELILTSQNISKEKFFFLENSILHVNQEENISCYRPIGYDRTEKIMNAFLKGFLNNYSPILLIHCSESFNSIKNIEETFLKLRSTDLVYSFTSEGKISLIGMNRFIPSVFQNKLEVSTIQKLIEDKCISGESINDEDLFQREINYSNG